MGSRMVYKHDLWLYVSSDIFHLSWVEQLFSVFFPQSLNSASPNLSCLCSVLYDDPSGCWPECVYREGGAGKHKVRECWWLMEWMDSSVEACFKMGWKYPRRGGEWQRRYYLSNLAVVFKITVRDNIYIKRNLKFLTHCYLTSKWNQLSWPAKMFKSKRKLSIDHPGLLTLLMD